MRGTGATREAAMARWVPKEQTTFARRLSER